MSSTEVIRGRARVEIEASIYGDYDDHQIDNLRAAVVAVCRAVDTARSRELADDLTTKAAR